MEKWPMQMKVCLSRNTKKRVQVRDVLEKIFENPNVEIIYQKEKIEPHGYSFLIIGEIKAENFNDIVKFNNQLSDQLLSELQKIFGLVLDGLRYFTCGLQTIVE